jgi:hypothetical protein
VGRFSRAVVALAVTSLLLVAGGAYALGSSSDSTITVCVNHNRGTLYKASKCARHDKQLSWNQQGPRGLQGPQGLQGAPGSPGQAGAPGSPAASIMTARTTVGIGEEGYFAASGPSTISGTESDVTVLTPDTTTVAQSFAVRDQVSTPGDNTRVYVLRVNGADTALTCSLVDSAHTCTDSAHSVQIPPDSEVSVHRAVLAGTGSSGGADGTAVLAAWRATTP